MAKNDVLIHSQTSSLRALENQVGQITNALNSRTQGTFPSDTENARPHGKEHYKAITLRSGTQLDRADKNVVVEVANSIPDNRKTSAQPKTSSKNEKVGDKNAEANSDSSNAHNAQAKYALPLDVHPPPPFPLVEALERMPNYVMFMKYLLLKKKRLGEFEALTVGCTFMLTNKLPPKLKDPGSFTILYSIGNQYVWNALFDLGASINLMPLFVFKKLGIGEARSTIVTLQLAYQSYAHPEGKIEDVLLKVDKFIFHVDFFV
ncbi:uncharacterized protein LOC105795759 [Gossypium raimondii]|uniref:uncharacterized protein LOC105795759 n=1 Tax=Gossypium raimondii TaxID=29730 RepID=UPI00063AFF55|nr:uncharacterized protein LOC105795759 [Gossypium raimondii]